MTENECRWMARGILPKLKEALADVRRVPLRADSHAQWMRVDRAIREAISTAEWLLVLADYFRRHPPRADVSASAKRAQP